MLSIKVFSYQILSLAESVTNLYILEVKTTNIVPPTYVYAVNIFYPKFQQKNRALVVHEL